MFMTADRVSEAQFVAIEQVQVGGRHVGLPQVAALSRDELDDIVTRSSAAERSEKPDGGQRGV
jgi:hypothetical protein